MILVPILKKLNLFKILITLILFYGAFLYENALTHRATILILLYITYLIINLARLKIRNEKIILLTYIIEISLIYIMEQNSRYLINYILHLFYFLALLEIPLNLNRVYSLVLCTITMIISSIKFIILLVNKSSLGNLYQSVFFIATGISLLLLMNFLKYYKDEKESKEKLNEELLRAREKLKEAAIIQERNKIARDIHDTIVSLISEIGHSLLCLQ
ncbi:hypothetical protein [Proteiniborus sp. MB09-C3]|uniref:hypothetical protein n=1 Tax=Proteiniborus sp. MB09-C3 TaxID=3050072 RepID=UPI00255405AD|nr:hypothetical protein [Proteiniborus sp. MB09-C3]WIV10587.1 hypothetical protein QO263_10500 [Proteiniborus sp. MB09-C3]